MSASAQSRQHLKFLRHCADRSPPPRRFLALALLLVPTLAVFADKSTVPTLLVAAVVTLALGWCHGWRPARPSLTTLAIGAAVWVWIAIACLWSFDPSGSLSTAVRLLVMVVCGWALGDVAARVPDPRDPHGRKLARAAVIGLAMAAAVLLAELLSDMAIKSTVTSLWNDDPVLTTATNRGGTFIVVALWLVLPLTALATYRARLAALCLAGLSCAAIAVGESGTNQVALAAGAGFFALAWLGRWARVSLWALAIAIGLVAMPWLAQAMFDAGWHENDKLGTSIQHRFFIWNYASEWAFERPWFGWGYDSSHAFSNRGIEPWPRFSTVIPLHPHNAALQVMLELGIAGLLLAILGVARLAWCLEVGSVRWAPWLGAAAMAALVAANLGYGLWQTQWVATLIWLTCYARLFVSLAPDPLPTSRTSSPEP